MAFKVADRVLETSTTTGTGVITLAGAVAGFQTFAAGLTNGDTCSYAIVAVDANGTPTGQWETGIGTYSAGTLVRTTPTAGSAGTPVSFAAGTKHVFISGSPAAPFSLSDHINLTEVAEPAVPSGNHGVLWLEDQDGISMLRHKGATFDVVRTITQDAFIIARNITGGTLSKGAVVYVSGSSGQRPTVALARADVEATMPALGVVAADIGNNTQGLIMVAGHLFELDTSAWAAGDVLYVSPTTAGLLTTTAPVGGDIVQRVAVVTNDHATQGKLLVTPHSRSGGLGYAQYFAGQADLIEAPPPGNIGVFSLLRAGRPTLNVLTGSGHDYALQPWLATNKIVMWIPESGTTVRTWGMPLTNVGTVSTPAITSASLAASARHYQLTSATTANAAAQSRSSALTHWRGNAAGLGGFTLVMAININSAAALQRGFFGCLLTTGAIATTQSPAALVNGIGFQWESSETTLQIGHNDGAGSMTRVDLGANFPTNNTAAVYTMMLFCRPNDDRVRWFIQRDDTGDTAEGEFTTDIPANNIMQATHLYMNNGGTAAAASFRCYGVYLESDR